MAQRVEDLVLSGYFTPSPRSFQQTLPAVSPSQPFEIHIISNMTISWNQITFKDPTKLDFKHKAYNSYLELFRSFSLASNIMTQLYYQSQQAQFDVIPCGINCSSKTNLLHLFLVKLLWGLNHPTEAYNYLTPQDVRILTDYFQWDTLVSLFGSNMSYFLYQYESLKFAPYTQHGEQVFVCLRRLAGCCDGCRDCAWMNTILPGKSYPLILMDTIRIIDGKYYWSIDEFNVHGKFAERLIEIVDIPIDPKSKCSTIAINYAVYKNRRRSKKRQIQCTDQLNLTSESEFPSLVCVAK